MKDQKAREKANKRSNERPVSSQPVLVNNVNSLRASFEQRMESTSQPTSLSNRLQTQEHLNNELNENIEEIRCPVCSQCFDNQKGLRAHLPSHPVYSNNLRIANMVQQTTTTTSESNQTEESSDVREMMSKWTEEFRKIESRGDQLEFEQFDIKVKDFLKFLYQAIPKLPGPKHPISKYYEKRKKRRLTEQSSQYSRSSNPQRKDTRARQRRKDRFNYELAQFEYHHQRRKVVKKVMNSDLQKNCPIDIKVLTDHFRAAFGQTNDSCRDKYETRDTNQNITVTLDEVNEAIKRISIDTSPGPDQVLVKTLRDLNAGAAIKSIMNIMLNIGKTPTKLTEGRTVLIPKDGDPSQCSNYRPITIYSVVRRVIERVLDKHVRDQVSLNCNQRGFITIPGCHVNSKIINACLMDAKRNKTDCVVVFLDISKAFDHIGHRHIESSLKAHGVSSNLRRLIVSLLKNNTIRLNVGKTKSDSIGINRSVPQGGPLSPILFNIAIDYIYKELCEAQFADQYGYRLKQDISAVSLTGFADDQAVTSQSISGASRIIELVQSRFQEIGLDINPDKSVAINIVKGKLVTGEIVVNEEMKIRCIESNERIRYLGCSFSDELVFDEGIIPKLTEEMNNLIQSPLLQNYQKMNVLNQYVLPKLTYPLQAAPLDKIPKCHLQTLDKNIRSTAKGIIGLPVHNTPNGMMYSSRKNRGLGMVYAEKEVHLQHYAIASKLSKVDDDLFHEIYDCEEEAKKCKEALNVEGNSTRQLREAMRDLEFKKWSEMSYAGIGISHYKTYTKANRFMSNKNALSASEWTAAIKLNCGYANLAGVPGVQSTNRRCRKCGNENETLAHVLGNCPFGSNRRNARHHRLKHQLAQMLREKGLHTIDEAFCVDEDGSNRFVDILAFCPESNKAYIIDPTIRYETNRNIDEEIRIEKRSIYMKCVEDLKRRYESFGEREYSVLGVWMGARGAVGSSLMELFDQFDLDKKRLPELAERTIVDSIKMIHHHIYS